MRQYAIKRIGLFIPTVLLVTIIVFVVMRLIPGDPALAILSADDAVYTQEELAQLRAELGTDRPIPIQYLEWISGFLQGDFGTSYWWGGPVMERLGERIPVTIELAILGILLAVVCAVPLGVISAIKPDSPLDYASRIFTLVGISIPTFFSGILLTLVLIRAFGWLPPLGYEDIWEDPWTNIKQLVLPALALGFYDMAFIARVTRSSDDGDIAGRLHEDSAGEGVARVDRVVASRVEERGAAGADHIRVAVRASLRRHGDHREDLPDPGRGPVVDRCDLPAGLSDDPGGDSDRGAVHSGGEPTGGLAVRVAGPPDQVCLGRQGQLGIRTIIR